MTREGVDEGSVDVVRGEVGLIVTEEDATKGGGKAEAVGELGDEKVGGDGGRESKGGPEGVTGIEDAAFGPAKQEVPGADMPEGWW